MGHSPLAQEWDSPLAREWDTHHSHRNGTLSTRTGMGHSPLAQGKPPKHLNFTNKLNRTKIIMEAERLALDK